MRFYPKLLEYKEAGIADEYNEGVYLSDDVKQNCLHIKFQVGGLKDHNMANRNGVFIEDLLIAAYAKLNEYNKKLPCRENSLALAKIEEAILWLDARTEDRKRRGVLGEDKE